MIRFYLRTLQRAGVRPFFSARNEVLTAFADSRTDDIKVSGFFGRLTFRWLRPLKGVLKWANIILGSMTAIFGGKDAVEEIKKVIEKGIEDGEDGEFSDGNIIFPRI
jgi:hypothetical protein